MHIALCCVGLFQSCRDENCAAVKSDVLFGSARVELSL
jgi:hypothetical protein